MKAKLAIVTAIAALALVASGTAGAANWSDSRLDAAASSVAGRSIGVWCEDSWYSWTQLFATYGEDGTWVNGFTYPNASAVYISPRQCETLHALLNDEDVGTYYAASAIQTLAHEATHLKLNSGDEGLVDCAALPLVPGLAVTFFGVPAYLSESYIVTVRRRVNGKSVTRQVVRYRTIDNPWLTRLTADAMRWHRSKPPEYQGNC